MKRSSSVRMGLPLPLRLGTEQLKKLNSSSTDPAAIVEREMYQLMVNDLVDFGRESSLGKRPQSSIVEYYSLDLENEFEIEQIEQAEMMIEDEV